MITIIHKASTAKPQQLLKEKTSKKSYRVKVGTPIKLKPNTLRPQPKIKSRQEHIKTCETPEESSED